MSEKTAQGARSLSRQAFERDVILRANAEPAFRQELLADPKAALQTAYGVNLPPDLELHVLEETPSRFYLVLPVQTGQLTDEELEAVAGGTLAVPGFKFDGYLPRTPSIQKA